MLIHMTIFDTELSCDSQFVGCQRCGALFGWEWSPETSDLPSPNYKWIYDARREIGRIFKSDGSWDTV